MTGADLRDWQRRLGLNQAEAARALALPYLTYRNHLTGRRPIRASLALLCAYVERAARADAAPVVALRGTAPARS